MLEINGACTFTGHRKLQGDITKQNVENAVRRLIGENVRTFFCGMAAGFDLLAADVVIGLKESDPTVKLIACVPCEDQSKYYSAAEKREYRRILERCDEVHILSKQYFHGCMQVRDRFMADRSDVVVAYLREKRGGTYYTVSYAASIGRRIVYL